MQCCSLLLCVYFHKIALLQPSIAGKESGYIFWGYFEKIEMADFHL